MAFSQGQVQAVTVSLAATVGTQGLSDATGSSLPPALATHTFSFLWLFLPT